MKPWQVVPDAEKGPGLTSRTNEELVLAALRGDVDSFISLCHRYYPAMVATAQAILGDHQLSEDAAQEALAKACRSLDSLKSPARFGAWLTAICRNEAKDTLRRNPRTESLGDRDVAEAVPQQNPDIDAVQEAMHRLPAESRELLYLRYRNGLSYQAISDLLGVSQQAVQGRLWRAKEAVREQVERHRERRLS